MKSFQLFAVLLLLLLAPAIAKADDTGTGIEPPIQRIEFDVPLGKVKSWEVERASQAVRFPPAHIAATLRMTQPNEGMRWLPAVAFAIEDKSGGECLSVIVAYRTNLEPTFQLIVRRCEMKNGKRTKRDVGGKRLDQFRTTILPVSLDLSPSGDLTVHAGSYENSFPIKFTPDRVEVVATSAQGWVEFQEIASAAPVDKMPSGHD